MLFQYKLFMIKKIHDMKKYFLLFLLTMSYQNYTTALNTHFVFLGQNQDNYKFQVSTFFSFGTMGNCPILYSTPDSLGGDTIFVRQLYSYLSAWLQSGCIANDTIDFLNIYPNKNFINLSVGYYDYNMSQPGVIDTFWSLRDTLIQINPLSNNPNQVNTRDLNIYPNPANTFVVVQKPDFKIHDTGVDIFNSTGQLIVHHHSSEEKQEIQVDISSLYRGVYFLKYDGVYKKLVIE